LLLGVAAGIVAIVVVFGATNFMLSASRSPIRLVIAEVLDFALLGLAGYMVFQNMGHSALARGFLIGISIVFLLNAICGVAMFVWR
jgi:hypothetical protein